MSHQNNSAAASEREAQLVSIRTRALCAKVYACHRFQKKVVAGLLDCSHKGFVPLHLVNYEILAKHALIAEREHRTTFTVSAILAIYSMFLYEQLSASFVVKAVFPLGADLWIFLIGSVFIIGRKYKSHYGVRIQQLRNQETLTAPSDVPPCSPARSAALHRLRQADQCKVVLYGGSEPFEDLGQRCLSWLLFADTSKKAKGSDDSIECPISPTARSLSRVSTPSEISRALFDEICAKAEQAFDGDVLIRETSYLAGNAARQKMPEEPWLALRRWQQEQAPVTFMADLSATGMNDIRTHKIIFAAAWGSASFSTLAYRVYRVADVVYIDAHAMMLPPIVSHFEAYNPNPKLFNWLKITLESVTVLPVVHLAQFVQWLYQPLKNLWRQHVVPELIQSDPCYDFSDASSIEHMKIKNMPLLHTQELSAHVMAFACILDSACSSVLNRACIKFKDFGEALGINNGVVIQGGKSTFNASAFGAGSSVHRILPAKSKNFRARLRKGHSR